MSQTFDAGPFLDAVAFAQNDFIEPFEAWAERLLLAQVALSEALAAHNRSIRQGRTADVKQRDAAWYRAQLAVLKGESSAPLLVRRIRDLRRSWRMHRLHAIVIPRRHGVRGYVSAGSLTRHDPLHAASTCAGRS